MGFHLIFLIVMLVYDNEKMYLHSCFHNILMTKMVILLDKNVTGLSTFTEGIEKELFVFKNVYPILCRRHCYLS